MRDGRPLAEQVVDMPGPWWLFLGGIYTGLNLALDFGGYALRSEGTELLRNGAMAAMGGAVAVWSAAIALAKRRHDRRRKSLDTSDRPS